MNKFQIKMEKNKTNGTKIGTKIQSKSTHYLKREKKMKKIIQYLK